MRTKKKLLGLTLGLTLTGTLAAAVLVHPAPPRLFEDEPQRCNDEPPGDDCVRVGLCSYVCGA